MMTVNKPKRHATVKSIVGIVLLLVIFSAILLTIGYSAFTDALLEQYANGAYLTAHAASDLINADDMEKYVLSGGKGEEYQKVWNDLDKLCNSSGSTFVYAIIPDTSDYAHITFVFSTVNHDSTYTEYDVGYVRNTTNDEYKEKYRALYEKTSDREMLVRDKGYIETDPHITVIVPLVASDGNVAALLCVQMQMDVLAGVRNRFFNNTVIALAVLIILVILGQSLFLNHTLLRPLKLISEEAIRFSNENDVPETKLSEVIKNKDEIGALAGSIDLMEEQIHDYIDNLTKITAEKQRIRTELALAALIQESMLPDAFPAFPDRREFDIYAKMDPAKEVGGDFYDFFLVDDDHLCIMIADVSGKGVPAALFMMSSKTIIANNAMMGKSPAQILTEANAAICAKNRVEMFVTVWLGILEISTGKLTAASAGHEYPFVKHANKDFELLKDKHGFVLGGMSGIKYKEYQITLEPGSKLFLYTDGVPEATSSDNEMFGTERLTDALNGTKDEPPEKILANVRAAVDGFVKEAEQFDDLTMLCLEYIGR